MEEQNLTTALYLNTVVKTANLSLDFFSGRINENQFSKNGLKIARSVEHELSNRMVLDMITSWAHVLLNKITAEQYFEKWGIDEEIFYEIY